MDDELHFNTLGRWIIGKARIVTKSPSGYRFPNSIVTTIKDVYMSMGAPQALLLENGSVLAWHMVLYIEPVVEEDDNVDSID